MLAVQAAQYAVSGMDFVRLKEVVARLIEDTTVFFCIDTLEYLRRGGRIGRVTAVAGSLLQIKPILTIGSDGVIGTAAKVRGRSAAFAKLLDLVEAVRQERRPPRLSTWRLSQSKAAAGGTAEKAGAGVPPAAARQHRRHAGRALGAPSAGGPASSFCPPPRRRV